MNRRKLIAGGLGAVILGMSLAGNLILLMRMEGMEKAFRDLTGQRGVSAIQENIQGGEEETKSAGRRMKLPETPILFKSAKWSYGNIELEFESESYMQSASASISPKIPVSCEVDGATILLSGEFRPGMKYRVTIAKGAKNASGGVLENDAVTEILIPDMPSDVSFVSSGTYLPLSGKKLVLPFRTVNCEKVEAIVYKAYENNLNPYRLESIESDIRMVQVVQKTLTFKTPKNQEIFHELDIAEMLGGRKPGVYRVTLNSSDQYVSITDMALQVVEDAQAGKLAVFIRSLSTGQAVDGAEIAVISHMNQLAASGKTDDSGAAMLSYDPAWAIEADHTVAVIARKDGDLAYFRLDYANKFEQTGDAVVPNAPRAFVFADRGVARPGEKITSSAFLRREQDGSFKPMPDTMLELMLLNPSGDQMFSSSLKSDAHGFAQVEFELPDTAATGVYSIVCQAAGAKTVCGKGTIRIASYVPDRIKVSGQCLTEQAGIEDMLEFEFDAAYYFGTPMESGAYRYAIRAIPGPAPAHWDKSWMVGDPDAFTVDEALSGKGKKEKGSVKLQYPGFVVHGGSSFNPVQIVTEFAAAEPGGRYVTGRVWKTLYPTSFFLGLRAEDGNGREKRFEYTLLPSTKCDTLQVQEDFTVVFTLIRKEWEYALVRDQNRWKREWTQREIPLPDQKRTISIPAGEYRAGKIDTVAWDLPSGEYTLLASTGERHRTRVDFSWYSGEGGERSASPNSIYFRTDVEQIEPGKNLTFHFDAAGEGEAFLVYGERVLSGQKIVPVKAGVNSVNLTVPEELHSSSFFVGCTVVVKRGETLCRTFGLLKVKVDQSKRHQLQVALEHPENAEPEAEIPVSVTMKDGAGQPQGGAVCLYAVDSGVISLTEYKVPDIFRYFFGEIACPMVFFDMYGLLYEDLKITPDGKIGGDAAAKKLGAIKQKDTARLIAPLIVVPASGTATVMVRLPDHTGSMDIFAVASSDNAVGSAQSSVIMRKPVTVTVTAPRVIAPGDTAELSFTVFNHAVEASDYSCHVMIPSSLEVLGGASNILTGKGLSKGKQQSLTMKVCARELFQSGKITASLTVGTAQAKDDAYITVRSVNVSQSAYCFAALMPGESFQAEFGGDYIGKANGSIRLSASPALAVHNALDWLNDYPHGCLEQTTAAAFPFLALPTLEKAGLIDEAIAKTNRHKVAGAYAKMLAMSLSDGSFAMWPGENETWSEASVFALHFIFEAEKRDRLPLDSVKRSSYVKWLRAKAEDADSAKRAIRAYAAYVLAVAGDKAFLTAARNLIESTEKPDYALLLAGGSLVKGGYASLGTPAMRDALAAECWREDNVPTMFSDNACRLGMALYILMDCALPGEELPTRMAFELAKSIRSDGSAWGTTQANAWAALGLAAYAEKFRPVPAQAEIVLGDKREMTTFSGVKTLPAENDAMIINRSAGTLIVESTITGIPRKTPPNGGKLILSKEYLNEKGKAVTSVQHGDKVYVRICFESPADLESIVIADLLPAGLEIEDELLATRAMTMPKEMASKYGALCPKRLEKRDDRFLLFGDTARGSGEIIYQTRAVIRGSFVIPPVHAEAMYQPDTSGIFGNMGMFDVK